MDAVHRLSQELQASDRQLRPSRVPARSLPRSYVDGLRSIDRRGGGRLFVADSSTGPVAYLACALESDPFESNPLAVKITDFVVTGRWRRKGVGSALIDAAENFARERNARSIAITTLAENAQARRAYRALGFRESAMTLARPTGGQKFRRAAKKR
jgi:GNAT superfamily N-acetyltransferase